MMSTLLRSDPVSAQARTWLCLMLWPQTLKHALIMVDKSRSLEDHTDCSVSRRFLDRVEYPGPVGALDTCCVSFLANSAGDTPHQIPYACVLL